jgi:hypothetical protein
LLAIGFAADKNSADKQPSQVDVMKTCRPSHDSPLFVYWRSFGVILPDLEFPDQCGGIRFPRPYQAPWRHIPAGNRSCPNRVARRSTVAVSSETPRARPRRCRSRLFLRVIDNPGDHSRPKLASWRTSEGYVAGYGNRSGMATVKPGV